MYCSPFAEGYGLMVHNQCIITSALEHISECMSAIGVERAMHAAAGPSRGSKRRVTGAVCARFGAPQDLWRDIARGACASASG